MDFPLPVLKRQIADTIPCGDPPVIQEEVSSPNPEPLETVLTIDGIPSSPKPEPLETVLMIDGIPLLCQPEIPPGIED